MLNQFYWLYTKRFAAGFHQRQTEEFGDGLRHMTRFTVGLQIADNFRLHISRQRVGIQLKDI